MRSISLTTPVVNRCNGFGGAINGPPGTLDDMLEEEIVSGQSEGIKRQNTMLKTYHGSCHCGAVRFEADLDLTQSSYRCNCSICRRNRFWPAVATPEHFRLITGESELTQYLFNTRKNHHYFCKHCGVRPFGIGNDTPVGVMYGVNLGCLEDITEEELAQIPITYVDGLNDRSDRAPQFHAHL